jgi:hypothetical protein
MSYSQQVKFTRLVARLIDKAFEMGYEVTLGDAYRDPRLHGQMGEKKGYGASKSYHKIRLAIDLNLFKNGVWLKNTEDHRELGEWWEAQDHECTWGGNFRIADGNHYSFGEGR